VATTASRVIKGRSTSGKPTGARGTPRPKGGTATSPKSVAARRTTTAAISDTKLASAKASPAGISAAPKPNRMMKMMESVQSVQEAPPGGSKPWPLWRKIALWAVMLMPIYAILIYLIGGVYFVHAGLNGVGVNKSLSTHVLKVVNGVSIPDQEGVFLQLGADPQQPLNLIMPYNDRALKPPLNQQFTSTGTALRYILVRQAQVSLPTDYQVFLIDNKDIDHLVKGVVAQRVPVERIALISLAMANGKPWATGSYVLVTPDLDDGTYYYFFTVTQ
jgi:hypothetical protein